MQVNSFGLIGSWYLTPSQPRRVLQGWDVDSLGVEMRSTCLQLWKRKRCWRGPVLHLSFFQLVFVPSSCCLNIRFQETVVNSYTCRSQSCLPSPCYTSDLANSSVSVFIMSTEIEKNTFTHYSFLSFFFLFSKCSNMKNSNVRKCAPVATLATKSVHKRCLNGIINIYKSSLEAHLLNTPWTPL